MLHRFIPPIELEHARKVRDVLADRLSRFPPALDGGEDGVGPCGPDEGFGIVVSLGDEAVDGARRPSAESSVRAKPLAGRL